MSTQAEWMPVEEYLSLPQWNKGTAMALLNQVDVHLSTHARMSFFQSNLHVDLGIGVM